MHKKLFMSNPLVASMIAAALMLAGAAALGAQAQIPRPTVSQANADTFRELAAAATAKRYSEVDAKAKAVLASSGRTKDDTFAAYQYLMQSAQARNDIPGMMAALEGQLDSGFLPASAQGSYYLNLIGLAYKVPDYRKAIEYGQKLIKMGGASADVYQYVGQAYYELKDYKAAVNFFSDLVARKEKAGRRPDRNELILLQSSYQRAGDKAAARATLQKVVRYYPDPSTWALLIHEVKRARLDSRQKLHLYRLMQATGNLKEPQEYMDYSLAAMDTGLMGESEKVLENGIREKVFRADADRSRAERYRKSAAAEAASKRSELARLEAAAKTAGTGNEYISLGTTLYSLGRYDQAVDALRAGIAKGKLTNEADAHLTLGMALLKAGQKAEARKAFSSTKSDDEVTHRIAELWALYTS